MPTRDESYETLRRVYNNPNLGLPVQTIGYIDTVRRHTTPSPDRIRSLSPDNALTNAYRTSAILLNQLSSLSDVRLDDIDEGDHPHHDSIRTAHWRYHNDEGLLLDDAKGKKKKAKKPNRRIRPTTTVSSSNPPPSSLANFPSATDNPHHIVVTSSSFFAKSSVITSTVPKYLQYPSSMTGRPGSTLNNRRSQQRSTSPSSKTASNRFRQESSTLTFIHEPNHEIDKKDTSISLLEQDTDNRLRMPGYSLLAVGPFNYPIVLPNNNTNTESVSFRSSSQHQNHRQQPPPPSYLPSNRTPLQSPSNHHQSLHRSFVRETKPASTLLPSFARNPVVSPIPLSSSSSSSSSKASLNTNQHLAHIVKDMTSSMETETASLRDLINETLRLANESSTLVSSPTSSQQQRRSTYNETNSTDDVSLSTSVKDILAVFDKIHKQGEVLDDDEEAFMTGSSKKDTVTSRPIIHTIYNTDSVSNATVEPVSVPQPVTVANTKPIVPESKLDTPPPRSTANLSVTFAPSEPTVTLTPVRDTKDTDKKETKITQIATMNTMNNPIEASSIDELTTVTDSIPLAVVVPNGAITVDITNKPRIDEHLVNITTIEPIEPEVISVIDPSVGTIIDQTTKVTVNETVPDFVIGRDISVPLAVVENTALNECTTIPTEISPNLTEVTVAPSHSLTIPPAPTTPPETETADAATVETAVPESDNHDVLDTAKPENGTSTKNEIEENHFPSESMSFIPEPLPSSTDVPPHDHSQGTNDTVLASFPPEIPSEESTLKLSLTITDIASSITMEEAVDELQKVLIAQFGKSEEDIGKTLHSPAVVLASFTTDNTATLVPVEPLTNPPTDEPSADTLVVPRIPPDEPDKPSTVSSVPVPSPTKTPMRNKLRSPVLAVEDVLWLTRTLQARHTSSHPSLSSLVHKVMDKDTNNHETNIVHRDKNESNGKDVTDTPSTAVSPLTTNTEGESTNLFSRTPPKPKPSVNELPLRLRAFVRQASTRLDDEHTHGTDDFYTSIGTTEDDLFGASSTALLLGDIKSPKFSDSDTDGEPSTEQPDETVPTKNVSVTDDRHVQLQGFVKQLMHRPSSREALLPSSVTTGTDRNEPSNTRTIPEPVTSSLSGSQRNHAILLAALHALSTIHE